MNRLSSAKAGDYGTFTYSYDKVGNRLTEGRAAEAPTNNYSYVAGTNRLSGLSINGTAIEGFTYTPTGNIVDFMGAGEPTVSLNYNKANRVGTIAENGAQIAQYLYDGFGQRLVKNFSGTPAAGTLFAYGQDGSLLEETNISGKAQADYIYLDGMPIGDYAPGTKTLYYLHTDHLGTPQLATNNAKAVEWQAIYEPFGWQNTVSGTITQNLSLPGQYFDSETTSYHNGFRDYVAILGRYGQSDPTGLSGGINTYAYANGNPGRFTDQNGLATIFGGAGISLEAGFGIEGSLGVLLNPGWDNDCFDIGFFAAPGGGAGVNLGGNLFVGAVRGSSEQLSGPSLNVNAAIGPVTGTLILDPKTGNPVGATIGGGIGLPGVSTSGTYTGTLTLNDLLRKLGFSRCGCKSKLAS